MSTFVRSLAPLLLVAAVSCTVKTSDAPQPLKVIFETDFGNDTDDAIAIDLLHTYMDMGKAELLAVNVNKKGLLPAEFADAVNTFYGRGDIPVGVVDGTSREEDAADDYCRRTLDSVKFERSIKDYTQLPPAYKLSRKILAAQPDTSVTFVSVGFSTNLAALLDSGPDEFSPLDGKALVARKVRKLSIMAGNFENKWGEFNVANDIPAAAKVFAQWPTDIVVSPWELGDKVKFKGSDIGVFEWYDAYPPAGEKYVHPVAVAYREYIPMPYDRPMWDPTATIYGVEGELDLFTLGPRGTVTIDADGISTFREDPAGRHRIMSVTEEQAQKAHDHLYELCSRIPDRYFRDYPNYFEDRIPPYTNADPLTFADGRKVRFTSDWKKRREEILEIFQSQMYGRMPAPSEIYLDTLESGPTCHAYGTRTQVRMWFKPDRTGPFIDWLCVTPKKVKGKSPVILSLNYNGNHTVLPDEQIIIADFSFALHPDCVDNLKDGPEMRGRFSGSTERKTFPIGVFLAKGYSFVTASYNDVSPDPEWYEGKDLQKEFAHSRGVFELWEPYDSLKADGTTALAAWGWALSRGMDMIERSDSLDCKRVLLTGYSRLGKAALIAGAFDERFPVVAPVQTGGGGAPLARRYFGENVMTSEHNFKHWYCPAYFQYSRNEENMPFDQHMLLSCVAPRALLIEGFDNKWYDPKGEFESVQEAGRVWKFLGQKGLPEKAEFPELYATTAIGPRLGYVWRDNEHGQADDDWMWALEFADKVFSR